MAKYVPAADLGTAFGGVVRHRAATGRKREGAGFDFDASRELCLVLTLREARKMKLSGKKDADIVEALFAGNSEEYEQLSPRKASPLGDSQR